MLAAQHSQILATLGGRAGGTRDRCRLAWRDVRENFASMSVHWMSWRKTAIEEMRCFGPPATAVRVAMEA